MPLNIVCAGQKGGVGKSTIARAFAVGSMVRNPTSKLILADLDYGQRTALEWAEARNLNNIEPLIHVEVVDLHRQGFHVKGKDKVDYIIYDCPGWSDYHTLAAASFADLVVLPTGPGQDDLRPLMRLCFELEEQAVDLNRVAIALVRTHTDAEINTAREFLSSGGLAAVDGDIREGASVTKIHGYGQSVLELNAPRQRQQAEILIFGLIDKLSALGPRKPKKRSIDIKSLDWSVVE